MRTRNLILFLLPGLLLACGKDTPPPPIPYVVVNEQINLTNIQYNKLRQENGFVYLEEKLQKKVGVRGIIVVRLGHNNYAALERACTYHPNDPTAVVEVDASGIFLIDPKCKSQFDLSGQVLNPPANYPLRRYSTYISGNFLYINN